MLSVASFGRLLRLAERGAVYLQFTVDYRLRRNRVSVFEVVSMNRRGLQNGIDAVCDVIRDDSLLIRQNSRRIR